MKKITEIFAISRLQSSSQLGEKNAPGQKKGNGGQLPSPQPIPGLPQALPTQRPTATPASTAPPQPNAPPNSGHLALQQAGGVAAGLARITPGQLRQLRLALASVPQLGHSRVGRALEHLLADAEVVVGRRRDQGLVEIGRAHV